MKKQTLLMIALIGLGLSFACCEKEQEPKPQYTPEELLRRVERESQRTNPKDTTITVTDSANFRYGG